jgi:hypothetical protein
VRPTREGTFRLRIERYDRYVAVSPSGPLDDGAIAELQATLRRVGHGKQSLVLDLRSLVGLGRRELRLLLEASEEGRRAGWAMVLFP